MKRGHLPFYWSMFLYTKIFACLFVCDAFSMLLVVLFSHQRCSIINSSSSSSIIISSFSSSSSSSITSCCWWCCFIMLLLMMLLLLSSSLLLLLAFFFISSSSPPFRPLHSLQMYNNLLQLVHHWTLYHALLNSRNIVESKIVFIDP